MVWAGGWQIKHDHVTNSPTVEIADNLFKQVASRQIWGMGKAGKALKQILEAYGIPQNRLAVTMKIDRSNISRWVSEERDPTGDAIADIKDALEKLDPSAAEEFVKMYLSDAESLPPDNLEPNWPLGSSRLILFEPTKFCAIPTIAAFKDASPWWYPECSDT